MSYKKALEKFETAPINQTLICGQFFKNSECCAIGFLAGQYKHDIVAYVREQFHLDWEEARSILRENDDFDGSTQQRFKHVLKFLQKQVELENE